MTPKLDPWLSVRPSPERTRPGGPLRRYQGPGSQLPSPQPTTTITVGTFNSLSGTFHYAVPVYHHDVVTQPQSGTGGGTKPEQEQLTGGSITAVNAFGVKLRFVVTGRQGAFAVSVHGHPTVQANANSVEVDVGQVSSVTFALSCNGNDFFPELPLKIARPIVAAGAITIKALPITVVYAPPVDQQQRNTASWSGSELTGTTTTVSFREQNTTAAPIQGQFEPWIELIAEMHYASAALSLAKDYPYVKEIVAALDFISGALGSSTFTQGSGTTMIEDHSLTMTLSSQSTLETNPHGGGPGAADILFFLRNAKICWYTDGGSMKLALLAWDAVDAITASLLQNPPAAFPLDLATRSALLDLDPFVAGGPGALLSPPRYQYITTLDVNATYTYTVSYTISNTDRTQMQRSQFDVEDDSASFLAFANIGVTQTVRAESVLTQTSTSETTTATTITRQVQFFADPDEFYSVEVYCDVIFGTFAFRSIGSTAIERIRGRALDRFGHPIPHAEVTMISQEQHFQTLTDAEGNFSFRAATLGSGRARLHVGTAAHDLDLRGEPDHQIEVPTSRRRRHVTRA